MNPGELFEIQCYEYLKKNYKSEETDFLHYGGMNSTKSDIAAVKNGKPVFYIEAKEALAQSGQFVLLPDEKREEFVFSSLNHSEPNEMTNIIIDYMNRHFKHFDNAGTAGQALEIDSGVFSDWIVNYYKKKGVKYVISRNEDYVILPIRRFKEYFEISAKYRIKKSGSGKPAKKDIPDIEALIKKYYSAARFSQKDKKLFAWISEDINKDRFVLGRYTYFLSERDSGSYEVRRLSNTYNMNVIFSVKLIKSQDKKDLTEFKSEL